MPAAESDKTEDRQRKEPLGIFLYFVYERKFGRQQKNANYVAFFLISEMSGFLI
jgi:hypothetical protein